MRVLGSDQNEKQGISLKHRMTNRVLNSVQNEKFAVIIYNDIKKTAGY